MNGEHDAFYLFFVYFFLGMKKISSVGGETGGFTCVVHVSESC